MLCSTRVRVFRTGHHPPAMFPFSFHKSALVSSLLVFLAVAPCRADVRLPHVLGSNMVLQRDKPAPVRGTAGRSIFNILFGPPAKKCCNFIA